MSGPNFSLLNDSKCNYSDYHVTSSSSSPPPHNFNRITGYVFRNYATESKKKRKKKSAREGAITITQHSAHSISTQHELPSEQKNGPGGGTPQNITYK
ncbi:hypothetical protein PP707_04330 [Acetobacter pasteurianus]|nr:hypothetical protein [Acetobacter pasteurianus]